MRKEFGFFVFLTLLVSLFFLPEAQTESALKIKATEEKIREQMLQISKELGTTCTECHNMKNLKDDSKKSYKIAFEHIQIVKLLKTNGFDGQKNPEASCYMCHKGQLKFKYTQASDH